MPKTIGDQEKVKIGNREISRTVVERVFGAIRSGCAEIRPEGVTVIEINWMAKVGQDRAFYSAKYLLKVGRVAVEKTRIDNKGYAKNLYRLADAPEKKRDAAPAKPKPDAVTKKKKTKKPKALSSAVRVKLIESRHKVLIRKKASREKRMDRMLGPQTDAKEWSEDK